MKTHAKLTRLSLCQRLLGQNLGTNQNGNAGRMLENLLESWGVPINRGAGPDILVFGCEIKSRDRSATSSQTIADMNIQDIQARPYRDSQVRDKFQQQLRVFTENMTVVDAGIYDFSSPDIQELVEQAYEHARAQFGFLMDAFEYGAPPHGGIAFGFDRLCSLFGGSETIRDYIAFPKNNAGRDVMIDAPSTLDQAQLDELSVSVKKS